MSPRIVATAVAVAAGLLAGLAHAEVFVYPKPGQGQDAFQRDQYECHTWAQNQTGFNPSQPAPVAASPPERGGGVRGGARGAAVGALGGAIAGDAGKGAAIGAAVGGGAGMIRQGQRNQQNAQATQQAQGSQQAGLQRYEQAYRACLSGRGYQPR